MVRSRVRVRIRVRVKIFLGPYDSLFDSEGVFRRPERLIPERWGFGKYGHCQIGYRRKKIDFFHPVFQLESTLQSSAHENHQQIVPLKK